MFQKEPKNSKNSTKFLQLYKKLPKVSQHSKKFSLVSKRLSQFSRKKNYQKWVATGPNSTTTGPLVLSFVVKTNKTENNLFKKRRKT